MPANLPSEDPRSPCLPGLQSASIRGFTSAEPPDDFVRRCLEGVVSDGVSLPASCGGVSGKNFPASDSDCDASAAGAGERGRGCTAARRGGSVPGVDSGEPVMGVSGAFDGVCSLESEVALHVMSRGDVNMIAMRKALHLLWVPL